MGWEEAIGPSSPQHELGEERRGVGNPAKILEVALWTALVFHSYSVSINCLP